MSVSAQPQNSTFKPLGLFANPRAALLGGLSLTIALAWIFLLVILKGFAGDIPLSEAGPGMSIFNNVITGSDSGFAYALYLSVCSHLGQAFWAAGQETGFAVWTYFLPMWLAMSVAMMLPTAAPLLLAYSDIAETARKKKIATISPLVLAAGYLAVWAVFCLVAALVQYYLLRQASLTPALVLKSAPLAGLVLALAGLYQLSPLKQACLVKCRNPLPFLMMRWSTRPWGVFKMGLEHGAFCLACCWALMSVMFVAGLMNLVWMAILTLIMVLEKIMPNPLWLSRMTGVALSLWSLSITAGWAFG